MPQPKSTDAVFVRYLAIQVCSAFDYFLSDSLPVKHFGAVFLRHLSIQVQYIVTRCLWLACQSAPQAA